jgi:hypothetical protein
MANVAQYSTSQYRDAFVATAEAVNVAAASPRGQSLSFFSSLSKTVLEKAGIRQAENKSA